jgi:hypothetical protein
MLPASFADPANIPNDLQGYDLFTKPGETRSLGECLLSSTVNRAILGRPLAVDYSDRYCRSMNESNTRKTTIYLDPDLDSALRQMRLESGRSISSFVNDAVNLAFQEHDCDIEAFETRKNESDYFFDDVVADLERLDKI